MNCGMTDSAVGRSGTETAVPVRSKGMATEAQVGRALVSQHMTIRRAVDLVAG